MGAKACATDRYDGLASDKSRKGRIFLILAICGAFGASLSACANAERFLPAGFIKQEDLARDIPVNPTIAAAIAAREAEQKSRYPILAEQPRRGPTGLSAGEQSAWEGALTEARARLEAEVAEDRARAERDRALPLDARAAEIDAAVDKDRKAASRERLRNGPPPAAEGER